MNFLDLLNACLKELNELQIRSIKQFNDKKYDKIKEEIHIINKQICEMYNWNFLLRKKEIILNKNTGQIFNSTNETIKAIYVDDIKYDFYENFEKFLTNSEPIFTYSKLNNKILLPIFNEKN